MIILKRVTKNNLLKLVEMKKKYFENNDPILLKEINDFINNVINKDKHYYLKLYSYDFDNITIEYLI